MKKSYSPCPSCGTVNRVSLDISDKRVPICAKCKSALAFEFGVTELSPVGLYSILKSSPIRVVVDFWAPWCGPCLQFAPRFREVAGQMCDEWAFGKLNTEDYPEESARLGIRGIPTLIAFDHGQEVKRVSGAMAAPQLVQWLQSVSSVRG